MKQLDKEKFLKSEFGKELEVCIYFLDREIVHKEEELSVGNILSANYYQEKERRYAAQWEVFQLAMREFYGLNYQLRRTDEYYGVATADESDWLFKVMRKKGEQNG